MKERITITLNDDLLKKLDSQVGGDIRSRSHVIESILAKSLRESPIKKAVLFAAGPGVRLRPITYEIPKGMVRVKGKPVLHHQIELFKSHGIQDFILAVGYLGDQIVSYFGDGSRFGVHIEYVQVDIEKQGTVGVLQSLKPLLNVRFAVQNADTLMNPDISSLLEFHTREKKLATMMLVHSDNPKVSGVVKVSGTSIVEFQEKPEDPESNLINGGFYIFEPGIFDHLSDDPTQYIEKTLFPELVITDNFSGFVSDKGIFDIGTPERYEKAIKEWEPFT